MCKCTKRKKLNKTSLAFIWREENHYFPRRLIEDESTHYSTGASTLIEHEGKQENEI